MTLSYSTAAQNDLDEIASYTAERWGYAQAERYLAELEDCCALLMSNPWLGHPGMATPGDLRCLYQGSHAIHYLPQPSAILIVRILHQRMLPMRDNFDIAG